MKVQKLLSVLCFVLSSVVLGHKMDVAVEDIFDNDSEFMRGFETGLFLRTKGGKIEEYGCEVQVD